MTGKAFGYNEKQDLWLRILVDEEGHVILSKTQIEEIAQKVVELWSKDV